MCCCGYLPYNVLLRITEEDDLELVHNLFEQREIALEEAIEEEELVPQYEASFFTRASRKLSLGDNKRKKIRSNNVTPVTTPRHNDKTRYSESSSSSINSPRNKVRSDESKLKSISSSLKNISRTKSKDVSRKAKSEKITNSSCSSELEDDSPGRSRKFVFTMSKSVSPKNLSPKIEEVESVKASRLYVSDPPPTSSMFPNYDKANVEFQMIVEGSSSTSKKKEKRPDRDRE